MDTLNQMELQDIRHVGGACGSFVDKLNYYAGVTNDKTALDIMERLVNASTNLKNELKNSLN